MVTSLYEERDGWFHADPQGLTLLATLTAVSPPLNISSNLQKVDTPSGCVLTYSRVVCQVSNVLLIILEFTLKAKASIMGIKGN